MKMTKWMAAGTAAASMGVGGLVGSVVLTPAVSGAQSDGTQTVAEDGGHPMGDGRGMDIAPLSDVADAIGITTDDLLTALADDQTIAQVAEANSVDPQTVIDALVNANTDRMEQRIAELPDRMAELVNNNVGGPGFAFHGERGPGPHHLGAPMGGPPDGSVDEPLDGAS